MSADELKQAALEALAEQAIVSAPREVFKLFPNWEAELRAMLPHQGSEWGSGREVAKVY